jgi:hypothetical protein
MHKNAPHDSRTGSHVVPEEQVPVARYCLVVSVGQVELSHGQVALVVHEPTLPDTLQLWQLAEQTASQHTFSAEQTRPDSQSVSAAQASPRGSFPPHRLLVLRQVRLFAQSVSDVQLLRQVGLVWLQT